MMQKLFSCTGTENEKAIPVTAKKIWKLLCGHCRKHTGKQRRCRGMCQRYILEGMGIHAAA